MAVRTAAGTTLSISATIPGTFSAGGYAASDMNWSLIGEVVDGGTHGRKYAEVTHKPLASRGVQKFKGSFDEGQKTIQLGWDLDDVGQALLRTALLSDADYSFRVAYPPASGSGASVDFDYFQAKVMSFETQASSVDSVIGATVQLSLTTSSAGVGIVNVNG